MEAGELGGALLFLLAAAAAVAVASCIGVVDFSRPLAGTHSPFLPPFSPFPAAAHVISHFPRAAVLSLSCFRSERGARLPSGRLVAHRPAQRLVHRGSGRVRGVGGGAGRADRAGAAGGGMGVPGDVGDAGGGGRVQQRRQPRRQGHRVAARVAVQVGAPPRRRRRRGEGERPLPHGPGPDTHVQRAGGERCPEMEKEIGFPWSLIMYFNLIYYRCWFVRIRY